MQPIALRVHPIHLGVGGTADVEPKFTGDMAWYEDYLRRHASDGSEGRLVSLFTFSEPWAIWEMHPGGDEVVLCISGAMTLLREGADGSVTPIGLAPGDYAINPAGTWHTADAEPGTTALFITTGKDTQHRPR